jgi:TPR repeat protein
MRHLLSCLLLAYAGAAGAQVEAPGPSSVEAEDQEVVQGGLAWLVGDHVKARRHFRAAAQQGHPLGQYNLAMMLLHHEGGPCDSVRAVALLRKGAVAGVDLAREALDRMEMREAAQPSLKRPFPCLPMSRASRSTPRSQSPTAPRSVT